MNPLSNTPNGQYNISNSIPQGMDLPYKPDIDVEEESRKSHRRSKNDIEGRT